MIYAFWYLPTYVTCVKILAYVRDHVQRFYGNCQTLRGAQQGDPISAYLFILVLEIFFIFVKNNPKGKGLKIFKHQFLYIAYADDNR